MTAPRGSDGLPTDLQYRQPVIYESQQLVLHVMEPALVPLQESAERSVKSFGWGSNINMRWSVRPWAPDAHRVVDFRVQPLGRIWLEP